jgi:hypothetical protein
MDGRGMCTWQEARKGDKAHFSLLSRALPMLDQGQTDNPEYEALLWALHVLSKTAKFVT